MEFSQAIKERVSIRKYQKKDIESSQLAYILECGFRENELSQVLQLPSSLEVIAFIPVGYAEGITIRRPKRPLKEVVHREFYKN